MGNAVYKEDLANDAKYRVLIIDDNEIELKQYDKGLSPEFDVSFTSNANHAWELLNSAPLPDAIVLDVMMPNDDSFQLCNRIKETQFMQDVPIIFISEQTESSIQSQAFDLGGDDFVAKPLMMTELLARLRRHMALYRKTKKLESLIFIDPLTHLPNASKFQDVLNVEWARCARYWHHLTLLVIQIDNLNVVRESEGSDKYYSTIAGVAESLASAGNRPGDLVATLSKDKFAILLSDCGHDGATLKAKQILTQFENREIANTDITLRCTIGYAVAAPAGGGVSESIFAAVNEIMFEAQNRETSKILGVNGIIGVDE